MDSAMIEEWQKLDNGRAKTLLEEINPHLQPVPFNQEETAIRVKKLPFYKEHEFLELTDLSTVPGARKYALYKPGSIRIIDWTNQAIYETNEEAPIVLNEMTVTAYVKFFFDYVRGRHGRFLIIETVDDIRWQTEPPAQGRRVMQELLHPVRVTDVKKDGTFVLEAFMVFKDSLFKAFIHVQPDGIVSLSEEELKIEGIPVIQDGASL